MLTFRCDGWAVAAPGSGVVAAATLLIGAVASLWRPLLIAAVLAGVLSPLYESRAPFGRRRRWWPGCSPPRRSS
jgi:hypothetical protein